MFVLVEAIYENGLDGLDWDDVALGNATQPNGNLMFQ